MDKVTEFLEKWHRRFEQWEQIFIENPIGVPAYVAADLMTKLDMQKESKDSISSLSGPIAV
jgi:hypothetical protein